MTRRLMFAVLFLGLASPVLAQRMKVESKLDGTYPVSSWKTFDFKTQLRLPDAPLRDPELDAKVRGALTRELEARGMKRVEEGSVDFLVAYYGGVGQKVGARSASYGTPTWGGDMWSEAIDQATLVVDFVHGESNQLVWRGTVKAVIQPGSGQKRIGEATRLLIEKFHKDRAALETKRRALRDR